MVLLDALLINNIFCPYFSWAQIINIVYCVLQKYYVQDHTIIVNLFQEIKKKILKFKIIYVKYILPYFLFIPVPSSGMRNKLMLIMTIQKFQIARTLHLVAYYQTIDTKFKIHNEKMTNCLSQTSFNRTIVCTIVPQVVSPKWLIINLTALLEITLVFSPQLQSKGLFRAQGRYLW